MVNPGSIIGQIGESFEKIGEDVVKQTVQAPKDITGKAMESLGMSSSAKNPKKQQPVPKTPQEAEKMQKAEETKQAVARAALEEISGKNKSEKKEPTVWERLQKEEEEKKALEKKKNEEAAKQALPESKGKRPRGDLYGMKAKKTQTEIKGKRQD